MSKTKDLYQILFQQSKDGVFVINSEGVITDTNQAFREMVGYAAAQLKKLNVTQLIVGEEEQLKLAAILQQEGAIRDYLLPLRCKNGEMLDVLTAVTVQYDGNGQPQNYLGIVRDITNQKQAAVALEERQFILEALNILSQDILAELDPHAILETVVRRVVHFFNATSAYIANIDEAAGVQEVVAEHYAPEAASAEQVSDLGVQYNLVEAGIKIEQLKTTPYQIYHADDPTIPAFEAKDMQTHGGKTILNIPLVARGRLLGLIEIWESRHRREFTLTELEMAQAIGRQVALAVDNARLYRQATTEITEREQTETTLRQRQEAGRVFQQRLQALQLVTTELDRSDSLDSLYRQAVEFGHNDLGFERIGLLLLDEHTGYMRGTYGVSATGQIVDEHDLFVPPDERHLELIRAKGHSILYEDAPLFTGGQVTGRGWNAIAVLWDGAQGIGWLAADNGLTGMPPSEYVLDILTLYGDTIGHLISRKRREETERLFQQKLHVLQEVNLELSRISDMATLYRRVIELGREVLGFDRIGLLLYDKDARMMKGTFGTDDKGQLRDERYFQQEVTDPDILAVITEKQRLGFWQTKPLLDEGKPVGKGWNAMAPLWYEDQILGWLAADNLLKREPLHSFQPDLLALYAATLAHLIVRQQTAESLREQETLLRLVLDTIPQSVFWKDHNSTYMGSNLNFAAAVGVPSPEHLVGKSDHDFWPKEQADYFVETDRRVMETQEPALGLMEQLHQPDGAVVWAETNKAALYDANGNVIGVLGTSEDITERKQAEEALRESEQRLSHLVQQSPLAVIEWNLNFEVREWNRAAETIFGYTRETALGQHARLIIPQEYHQHVDAVWEGLVNQTGGSRSTNGNVRADGRHITCEWYNTPIIGDNGEVIGVVSLVQDITEQEKLQQQAQESLALLNQQVAFSQVVTKAQTEAEIINAMANHASHYAQVSVTISLLETVGETPIDVVVAHNNNATDISLTPIGTRRSHKDNPLSKFYSLDTVFISLDVTQDERLPVAIQQGFAAMNIASFAILPLSASGEWFGNMTLVSPQKEFFNEHTLAIYRSVAEQGTTALRAARLQAATQSSLARREREVALATQIAQEIASASDLNELYQRVVTQIHEQFGYYHTQLLRYDPALQTVALTVGYGEVGQKMLEMHHSIPVGVGLIGKAAASGKSILRPNLTGDPDHRLNTLLPDTKGELAVPIKLGDEVLGVLDVQSNQVDALNANDQLILEGLCGQVAVAIESTILRQEMESRLRELHVLQRQMTREGWREYQSVRPDTSGYQYDHAGVQLLTGDTAAPVNGRAANGRQAKSDGVGTAVTAANLPLQIRNETIGFLGIQASPDNPLTPDEQEFLDAVSKEVAEALEAARLFEQTQDALSEQERLTAELETVAQVSTVASTILEADALLQAVVDLSKTSFNLYHVHIYLLNETGRKLVLKAGAGNVGRLMALEGREIAIDADSLVARAARTRQGVLENNVRKTVDFLPHPLLPNTQAEMAIPMILGDKLVGVLDLQADKIDSFTAEDLKIQRTLASQIAIAIENARQYAEQVETSKKLREVDQLKSEFLASMSHELRTPLNSIIGFADVLLEGLDGNLNERMEEDVRLIRESGSHLRELIGDILDMSKIEAGRMELRYEDVDMRQMANDIMATAQPLAQQKGLDMYLDLDDAVSTVRIDRTRIRQVLWNIMGNAIKFTDKGSVSLSMRDEGSHLLVAIRDTGIGIKEENIAIVFEQFRQIDGGLNRAASGTGLGMPITKKLVEIHGGDIWIESVYGQGTTFLFTLPYIPPLNRPGTGPIADF
ncbi:MAG: PAS domain S-box protein [Anaerolineae bacterium]|nr:PAS domain S-box protein [Anaerolineae bacterium]